MRTEKIFYGFIFICLVLSVITNTVRSQGTDSRIAVENRKMLYIGLMVSPQATSIVNKGFSTYTLKNENGNSFNIGMEGGYYFSEFAGISVGAGMNSFSSDVLLDSYSISYNTTDDEAESFEMRISGKSITESQRVNFLNIPVCLNLRFSTGKKAGLYFRSGLGVNMPLSISYEGNGIFTYEGYYPAYPVLLQDLPTHGFPTNLNTNSSGTLKIKSLCLDLIAAAGATYYVNDIFQLSIGFNFIKSLGNISDYGKDNNFRLTSKADELKSIMEGSSSVSVQSLGVSLGLRYYLR